jgi:hypothetical protein
MDKNNDLRLIAATQAVAGVVPVVRPISMEGGVWTCAPVIESPGVVLTRWRVYEVKLPGSAERTRHFVGYCPESGEGRVSTAIEHLDPGTRHGVTASGSVYELQGPPGPARGWGEANYVWSRWKQLSGATDVADVTEELRT